MKTNPISFHQTATGRHLNLNACLKDALCEEPALDEFSQNNGINSTQPVNFSPDISALPCRMRVFVITALEGDEERWTERTKSKKKRTDKELKAILPALKAEIESFGGYKTLRNPFLIMRIQENLQKLYPSISDEQLALARNFMNSRKPKTNRSWKRA